MGNLADGINLNGMKVKIAEFADDLVIFELGGFSVALDSGDADYLQWKINMWLQLLDKEKICREKQKRSA